MGVETVEEGGEVKEVTIFEAADGARFNTAAECIRYEAMLTTLMLAVLILGDAKEDALSSGKAFIQHDADHIALFDETFERIILDYFNSECANRYHDQPTGFVWRLLSDSNTPFHKTICKYGHRRVCIDAKLREWEQPYFTQNPNPEAIAIKPSYDAR